MILTSLAIAWLLCAVYAIHKLYLRNPTQWGTALILGISLAPFFALAELTRNHKDRRP